MEVICDFPRPSRKFWVYA